MLVGVGKRLFERVVLEKGCRERGCWQRVLRWMGGRGCWKKGCWSITKHNEKGVLAKAVKMACWQRVMKKWAFVRGVGKGMLTSDVGKEDVGK